MGTKTRVECQTITSSHVRVRHPGETCSFTPFSASVSTLNHQIFPYLVQRRSFLSSCYHFNFKQAFKVNNLAPTTMHHGRCHWSRALCQVRGRACSCKKDPCSHRGIKLPPILGLLTLWRANQIDEKTSFMVSITFESGGKRNYLYCIRLGLEAA